MYRKCRCCLKKMTTDDDIDTGYCNECELELAQDDNELEPEFMPDEEIQRIAEFHHRVREE